MIRELRLVLVTVFVGLAVKVCPKDATNTLIWFTQIPLEK